MKKTLDYYQHYTNSHSHWKFRLLRTKLGWAGEGRFWALNNMIALSDDCILDINRKNLRATVISDLGMDEKSFNEFIQILTNDCELIINLDGKVTTEIVRENLKEVMKNRLRAKENRTQSQSNNKNSTLNLLSNFK